MILVAVTRENTKHDYKTNFSTAVNICRHYFKNGEAEAEVINPTKEKQLGSKITLQSLKGRSCISVKGVNKARLRSKGNSDSAWKRGERPCTSVASSDGSFRWIDPLPPTLVGGSLVSPLIRSLS